MSADFREALLMIRDQYRALKMEPACLKSVALFDKWIIVFDTKGQAGMAFAFAGEHAVYGNLRDDEAMIRIQPYVGKPLFDLAERLIPEQGILMRAFCLAVLNALSQPLLSSEYLERDYLLIPEDMGFLRKEDVVTVVGYGGIVKNIVGKCRELHVLDMRPLVSLQTLSVGETVTRGPAGITFHTAEACESVIPASDVLLLTGCTLVNGTFHELRNLAEKARVVGMFGPSAQLSPAYLTSRNVNYISSCRVRDAKLLSDKIMGVLPGEDILQGHLEHFTIRSHK